MATYTFRTGDLPKLDVDTDRGTDFKAWQQQWQAYRSLSGLGGETAAKQVQALQLCFSRDTLNIVENLSLTTTQKKDQGQIIAALKQYVERRVNETIERRNLRQRVQLVGESFDDFLVSLRDLAKTCNFCSNECLQKALRDQVIEGLQDGETIQELLQVRDLTLDQAITKCRGLEAAKKSRTQIQGAAEVNAFQRPPHSQVTCTGCGNLAHEGGRKKCPAHGQVCRNCGKIGHFSRVCRQRTLATKGKPKVSTSQMNTLSTNPPTELPLVQLTHVERGSINPAPTVKMQVTTSNGQADIRILPDSGADICAAGPTFVQALGEHMNNLAHSDVAPKAVNGSTLRPLGKIPNVVFQVSGKTTREDVHIYNSISGALISWAAAKTLGILPKHYPTPGTRINSVEMSPAEPAKQSSTFSTDEETDQVDRAGTSTYETHAIPTVDQIISEFPSVFDGQIRTMPGEKFHISLTQGARPFCVTTPRTIPFAYCEKLKQEIDLLVTQGVITPVTEPTDVGKSLLG